MIAPRNLMHKNRRRTPTWGPPTVAKSVVDLNISPTGDLLAVLGDLKLCMMKDDTWELWLEVVRDGVLVGHALIELSYEGVLLGLGVSTAPGQLPSDSHTASGGA